MPFLEFLSEKQLTKQNWNLKKN